MAVLLPFNNYNSHKLMKAVVADETECNICFAFCLNIFSIREEGGLHGYTVTDCDTGVWFTSHTDGFNYWKIQYVTHSESVFSFDILCKCIDYFQRSTDTTITR